jgi:hypothetical protein
MATKSSTEKPLKLNQKTFLKLMGKRETITKAIARQEKKLVKIDSELGKFADWLKNLTTPKP